MDLFDERSKKQEAGSKKDAFAQLEKLAERARGEEIPAIRVDLAAVLREEKSVAGTISPMAWAAGISAVAAGLLLIVTLHATTGTTSSSVASGTTGNDALFSAVKVEMP